MTIKSLDKILACSLLLLIACVQTPAPALRQQAEMIWTGHRRGSGRDNNQDGASKTTHHSNSSFFSATKDE